MKNVIARLVDKITTPFISVILFIHEEREFNKEERLARKAGK